MLTRDKNNKYYKTRSSTVADRPRTVHVIEYFASHSRSRKIIRNGTIRKFGYGFLFAFCSNYCRIFSRLWDSQRQRIKNSVTLKTVRDRSRSLKMAQFDYDFLLVGHCTYSYILYYFRNKARYWSNIGSFIARTMPSQAVCLSVRLSHAGILSKRQNISSNIFHHRVATPFCFYVPNGTTVVRQGPP